MRNYFLLVVFAAQSLCAVPTFAQQNAPAAPAHAPIIPLKPEELLPLLPAPPSGWKMAVSQANTSYMGWIQTQAKREFSYTPPAAAGSPAGATPAPPQVTRVRVTDTGYFPSFSGVFDDFKVGVYGNEESLMIESLPARRTKLTNGGERLVVFVKRRFLVQIETQNQPANSALAWLKRVDLRHIAAVPDSGSTQLPRPITVSRIDELEPKNNSSSQLYYANDNEMHPPARSR